MKKILFGVAALGLLGLAGAGLGLKAQDVIETRATGNMYYLVGLSAASNADDSDMYGASWNADSSTLLGLEDGGASRTIKLYSGDKFKYVTGGAWDGALGWDEKAGTAATNGNLFTYDETNIKCLESGTYKISIRGGHLFVDSTSTLYTNAYVQLFDGNPTYVYAYDSTSVSGNKIESLGAWPGTVITNYTTETQFNVLSGSGLGGIGLMNVPYLSSLANTKIIVHNNNGAQSGNQTLIDRGYYWNTGSEANADAGKAASAVMLVDQANVCALDAAGCDDLYDNSYGLLTNDSQKSYFNKTTFNGYSGSDVCEYLVNQSKKGSGANTLLESAADSSLISTPIIIASSILTAAILSGFFIARKRRAE